MNPRFSVVIPTFNRGEAIRSTIDAVLGLDFDSYEVIIVDDGSTDDTADRLAAVSDERVRVVRRANGGISAARNTGVDAASGEYVVPLDDDDVPDASWLRSFDETIRNTEASFVSCGCRIVEAATGAVVDEVLPDWLGPDYANYDALLLAGAFAVRREIYLAVGGFAEGLQCSHQTEFGLRVLPYCAANELVVATIDRPLISIARRPPKLRDESSPAKLLQGTEFLLARHEDNLSGYTRGLYHSIAGVAAYRTGQPGVARAHFMKATAAHPQQLRYPARLVVACVPPLAKRVWAW